MNRISTSALRITSDAVTAFGTCVGGALGDVRACVINGVIAVVETDKLGMSVALQ